MGKFSGRFKRGQKVVVTSPYSNKFALEGVVLPPDRSWDLVLVKLEDGSVEYFHPFYLGIPSEETRALLDRLADEATVHYLRMDMSRVIRDKVRNTFSDLPEAAVEAVTEELAPRILKEILWD